MLKMKNEEDLREGRGTRWWLNTEDRTALWYDEFLLNAHDLFNGRDVDRRALDRIGSDAEP